MKDLLFYVQGLDDFRHAKGTRYSFDAFLTMIILSYMGGHYSMQSIARFFNNNKQELIDLFHLPDSVPGYTQIRTFLQGLDYQAISEMMCQWAGQYMDGDCDQWVSVDGKGLRSTITDYNNPRQNFKAIASAFSLKLGIVIASEPYENGKESEHVSVMKLIERLNNKGVIFTLDALHCKKKPSKPSWSVEMTL